MATKTATTEKPKAKPPAKTKPEKPAKDAKAAKEVEFTEDGRRKTLRNPQILLLKALAAAGDDGLSRPELSAKCPGVGLTEHLGAVKPDAPKNKWTVGLVEQKFVKQLVREKDGGGTEVYCVITAAGKQALARLDK